jgi:hypothetical protein
MAWMLQCGAAAIPAPMRACRRNQLWKQRTSLPIMARIFDPQAHRMRGTFARVLLLSLLLFVQQSALACAVCCDLERLTDEQYHTGSSEPEDCEKCGYLSGAANALTPTIPAAPAIDLLAVLSDRWVQRHIQTTTAGFYCRGPPTLV